MQKLQHKNKTMTSRRAVAPVIATLLLVAIAVVGGSIIFVFSQGFFSSAQVSGAPQIESVEFVGYDASDAVELILHDGFCTNGGLASTTPCTTAAFDGLAANGLIAGERVAVYLQNQSAQRVTLSEVRLAGTEYTYEDPAPVSPLAPAAMDPAVEGEFLIVGNGDAGAGASVVKEDAQAILEPGEEVTLLLKLTIPLSEGRDAQVKITTANGAVFVGTIIAGQQSG